MIDALQYISGVIVAWFLFKYTTKRKTWEGIFLLGLASLFSWAGVMACLICWGFAWTVSRLAIFSDKLSKKDPPKWL